MNSGPRSDQSALSPHADDIEEEFRLLADEWIRASEFISSPTEIAMPWPYQRIIGLGKVAVPLILRELAREPRPWFWVLRAISGDDPIEECDRGDVKCMADAWQSWGKRNGYA